MYEETPIDWKRQPLTTGLVLLFVLLSPIGGGVSGPLVMWACDVRWETQGPCLLPDPVVTYFLISWLGPIFVLGAVGLGLVWWPVSVAVTLWSLGLFVRAWWEAFADWA